MSNERRGLGNRLASRLRALRRGQAEDEPLAEDLRALLAEVGSLASETEPERDLWPQIARRIAQPAHEKQAAPGRVGGRWTPVPAWAGLAAAAVVLVVLTSMTTLWLSGPGALADDERVRLIAAAARERDGVSGVRESLLAILEQNREAIPPDTLVAIRENLSTIDRAIAEIHLALERHPDNNALNLLLAETYRREVELLEQLEWLSKAPEEAQS